MKRNRKTQRLARLTKIMGALVANDLEKKLGVTLSGVVPDTIPKMASGGIPPFTSLLFGEHTSEYIISKRLSEQLGLSEKDSGVKRG